LNFGRYLVASDLSTPFKQFSYFAEEREVSGSGACHLISYSTNGAG